MSKLKRINIICEGATEDRFIEKVLVPYMKNFDIVVKSRLVTTNRKKGIAGGMTSYSRCKDDLMRWKKENSNDTYCDHYYSTMIDLYKLPTDFPGVKKHAGQTDSMKRVLSIEDSFLKDIKWDNFIPYIQLHEFESLVFANLSALINDYPEKSSQINLLKKQLIDCNDEPEKVNSRPQQSPSKRIEQAIGKYNKVKSGPMVAAKAGIDVLADRCPHFAEWIERLKLL